MPTPGADMTVGTLLAWMKKPGDEVKRGEISVSLASKVKNHPWTQSVQGAVATWSNDRSKEF